MSDSGVSETESVEQMEASPTTNPGYDKIEPTFYLQNILKVVLAAEVGAVLTYLGSKMI